MTKPTLHRRAIVALIATLAAAGSAAAQPVRLGAPFDVAVAAPGTSLAGGAVDGAGTAAVAWVDEAGIPRGGLVAFDGAPLGTPFTLDDPADTQGVGVGIAGIATGGFAAAWDTVAGNQSRVLAQCVDGAGGPLGSAARIDPGTHLHPGRPVLAAGPNGRSLAAWEQDTLEAAVVEGRFLHPDCTPASDVFTITTRAAGAASHPAVAVDSADRFLVAWHSARAAAAAIEAVLLAPDGAPLGPVNTFAAGGAETPPVVAPDPRGGFLVAWVARTEDGLVLAARRLDPPQLTPGPLLTLAFIPLWQGGLPSMAYQRDGTLLVAWRIASSIMARSYAPSSLPQGTAFRVNVPAEADRSPHVLAGPHGRYLVTWMSTRGTGVDRESVVRGLLLGLCGNGVLDPGETCDDANGRDDDCCSRTCQPTGFAGQCWLLSRRSLLDATARDTSCRTRCQLADRTVLVVQQDGSYHVPGSLVTCSDGAAVRFPDERGRVVVRGRRLEAEPANLGELDAAFRACSGARLTDMTARFRRSTNGRALRGRQSMGLRQFVGRAVHVHVRTKVIGAPGATHRFPEHPPRRRGLFECVLPLQVQCASE